MPRTSGQGPWSPFIQQWKAQQEEVRQRIVVRPLRPLPRFVAGADAAFTPDKRTVLASAVIYDRDKRRIIEVAHAQRPANVPYIPGFLAFREGDALLDAIARLRHEFGAICFDGHGYAHPRRCGVACYLAVKLDVPGIGVGKSRLIGEYTEPAAPAGSTSPLVDHGETIGLVLRTQSNVRPVFVSIGHKVDLDSAKDLALACCTRYRIPEPTRNADIEVGKLKAQLRTPQT